MYLIHGNLRLIVKYSFSEFINTLYNIDLHYLNKTITCNQTSIN